MPLPLPAADERAFAASLRRHYFATPFSLRRLIFAAVAYFSSLPRYFAAATSLYGVLCLLRYC